MQGIDPVRQGMQLLSHFSERGFTRREIVLPELLQYVSIAIRKRLWFQHYGTSIHFSTVVRNYLDVTSAAQWIRDDCFCDFRRISSLEYPLLLPVWLKYWVPLNLYSNRSIDAARYILLLIQAILNIYCKHSTC